jgi:cytochrome P450
MDATADAPESTEEEVASPFDGTSDMAAHPQPIFQALRDNSPVLALEGSLVLSRKSDIDEALRHPEMFTSNMSAVDLKNVRPLIPLQIDPPDHKKFRKLLDPIFAPRFMTAMEDDVAVLVNDLIDGFIERGEVDFSAEFSTPYPSQVFLTLLGLPLNELPRFLTMKDGIIRPDHVTGRPYGSKEADAYQQEVADSIYAYFNQVLDEREQSPQADLVSRFLSAEVEGNQLSREDILDICFLFLIAGLDTVSATLDCMFSYLSQHPEHRQQLVEDPSLIPSAIEELLRWETPVQMVARAALEDGEFAGCPVKKGDNIVLMLGSANTDDLEVEDAQEVRFDREVNRHIAFGGGIHRCLGSHLARMELRVALREWHRRIPEYSVEPDHTLVYTPNIRSIEHFPMRFTAKEQ